MIPPHFWFVRVVKPTLAGALLFTLASQGIADASHDAEYRKKIVGSWHDYYQGDRTMTIRPDGTATMVVVLGGWKAVLYASQLRFDMVWSIEDGLFKKRTTGGDPPGKVKAVLKMMGDHVAEPIVELEDDQLVLQDENGKRKYTWERVKPAHATKSN